MKKFIVGLTVFLLLVIAISTPAVASWYSTDYDYEPPICYGCGGSGQCPGCGGSGSVTNYHKIKGKTYEFQEPCDSCGGSGVCPACGGSGRN